MRIPSRGSAKTRRLSAFCAAGLTICLVIALGSFLLYQQRATVNRLHDDFIDRSSIAAGSIGGSLAASETNLRVIAEGALAGPPGGVPAAIKGQGTGSLGLAVVSAGAVVLGADPATFKVPMQDFVSGGVVAGVEPGDPLRYGNIVTIDGERAVLTTLPYTAQGAGRILVVAIPVAAVDDLSLAALTNSLGAVRGGAYMIDASGQTIVSTTSGPVSKAPAGSLAPGRDGESGLVRGVFYTANNVHSTTWTLILAADEKSLTAPVSATSQVAWLLFIAFAVAMVLLLVIGAVAMSNAARLAHSRRYDALTGLRNRALFLEDVQTALDRREAVSVLFIDLDGFKPINDTHGHATGDALLAKVAAQLTLVVRAGDLVGRFGGDEFVVLCTGTGQSDTAAVAERIQSAIKSPFVINGRLLTVGASIGIASYAAGTETAEALIHQADLAMYEAKNAGRGRTCVYASA